MNMTRNFKDSIFSAYFSDEETLLDAYSAIKGRPFSPNSPESLQFGLATGEKGDF